MGRLVYVREDREAEPRFTGPPSRGDFGGGGRGAFGYGGAGGGRQIYVSNVCGPLNDLVILSLFPTGVRNLVEKLES
jgi:hypothetical protein